MKEKINLIQHPILQHQLSHLRSKDTKPSDFRRILSNMSRLMAFEVMRDIKLTNKQIETPLEPTQAPFIDEELVIVSIMRAGNGMLDGVMQMIPSASIGHIGIYRDKFIHSTVEYYFKLPSNVEGKRVLILDPLLATASTAVAAVKRLKQYNVGPMKFLCVLAAPEGLAHFNEQHPDVPVYALSLERQLNEKNYILPGLGDAGDRLYGTL